MVAEPAPLKTSVMPDVTSEMVGAVLSATVTETEVLAEAFDEASRARTYTVFDPRSLQS